MKRVFPAFLLIWLSFASCVKEESVSIPDDILSQEKMAAVITDLHLLEARMNMNLVDGVISSEKNSQRHAAIYKKHSITGKQYYESFRFYSHHPELFEQIYEKAGEELKKMLDQETNEN